MKKEITSIEELQEDIKNIKSDIVWAKKNSPKLVDGFIQELKNKEKKLQEWEEQKCH